MIRYMLVFWLMACDDGPGDCNEPCDVAESYGSCLDGELRGIEDGAADCREGRPYRRALDVSSTSWSLGYLTGYPLGYRTAGCAR